MGAQVPASYGLFRGADWQERETFDMYGHSVQGIPIPSAADAETGKGYPAQGYVQPVSTNFGRLLTASGHF